MPLAPRPREHLVSECLSHARLLKTITSLKQGTVVQVKAVCRAAVLMA
jgi:hypothetical protein